MDNHTRVTDISRLAPSYPIKAATRLMTLLAPYATPALPSAISYGKRRYYFSSDGKPLLYLVKDGLHFARRRSDNRIIGTLIPPVLLGWSGTDSQFQGHLPPAEQLYLERRDAGLLLVMPLQEALMLACRQRLEMDVIALQSYHINHLLGMGEDNADLRAQEVIFKMLRRLMAIPAPLRLEFGVVKFIAERCTLGRSTIMRELRVLRDNGAIEMQNGKLIALAPESRPD